MAAADRYVRTGTPVPMIYPGTLNALTRAISDAQRSSVRSEGEHSVEMIHGSERLTLQVYEGGRCVYVHRAAEG